jgi:xanthine dehydrogenase accessory factor
MNSLERDGYSRKDFDRVHAPIGLPIGAKSPQEIAIAIIAEIISCFNGANLN